MICGILIKNILSTNFYFSVVTILTYLTNSLSFLSDFCWNKNKNKPKQPLLYSLFQDSEGTSTSTETNNTSYESPDTQLFGALRMRAWHHLGGAKPTSRKKDCYFSFWGRGGQQDWFSFDYVKIPDLKNIQIPFLWLKSAFWWHNKRFIWSRLSWDTL